jgi:hypothetical protein
VERRRGGARAFALVPFVRLLLVIFLHTRPHTLSPLLSQSHHAHLPNAPQKPNKITHSTTTNKIKAGASQADLREVRADITRARAELTAAQDVLIAAREAELERRARALRAGGGGGEDGEEEADPRMGALILSLGGRAACLSCVRTSSLSCHLNERYTHANPSIHHKSQMKQDHSLGVEFGVCASKAQARNAQRRKNSLAHVASPADARRVEFGKATRARIPAAVLDEIR